MVEELDKNTKIKVNFLRGVIDPVFQQFSEAKAKLENRKWKESFLKDFLTQAELTVHNQNDQHRQESCPSGWALYAEARSVFPQLTTNTLLAESSQIPWKPSAAEKAWVSRESSAVAPQIF